MTSAVFPTCIRGEHYTSKSSLKDVILFNISNHDVEHGTHTRSGRLKAECLMEVAKAELAGSSYGYGAADGMLTVRPASVAGFAAAAAACPLPAGAAGAAGFAETLFDAAAEVSGSRAATSAAESATEPNTPPCRAKRGWQAGWDHCTMSVEAMAERRSLLRQMFVTPPATMQRDRITKMTRSHMVISHLHGDHLQRGGVVGSIRRCSAVRQQQALVAAKRRRRPRTARGV